MKWFDKLIAGGPVVGDPFARVIKRCVITIATLIVMFLSATTVIALNPRIANALGAYFAHDSSGQLYFCVEQTIPNTNIKATYCWCLE